MSVKCSLGFHDWSADCESCGRYGITRSNVHQWEGCKCTTCGKTREEGHAWEGCKCSKCGKTRDEDHNWTGCKCSKCGKARHTWTRKWDEKEAGCSICGIKRPLRISEDLPQPTREDAEDAVTVARLIGYMCVYIGEHPIMVGIGEAIAWQIAAMDSNEFLDITRHAAQEAMSLSRNNVKAFCDQNLMLVSKHNFFFTSSDHEFLANYLKSFGSFRI